VTSKKTGLVDDNMRGRMAQVVPHVRRATLVGKSMDLKHTEAAMLAETLDGLSAGLFLVDAKGRVVHANEAARDILAAGDFLRSIDGRLVARDAEINQTLRDIFALAGDGDSALGNRGIALRLTARDGERYAAHVLPLSSDAGRVQFWRPRRSRYAGRHDRQRSPSFPDGRRRASARRQTRRLYWF